MSDQPVPTLVDTDEGELAFQEYFVRRKCEPRVKGFRFEGVERAAPAPGLLAAIGRAELVIFCPSNPWVSIAPILAVPGVREALAGREQVIAVSPIIGGKAVKGPAAKMFSELGIEPSALAVARYYGARQAGGLLTGFVLDDEDSTLAEAVEAEGIHPFTTRTLMTSPADRLRLAQDILAFANVDRAG
jgi:LPPG:FO 2-phospho-L-lactate transferase